MLSVVTWIDTTGGEWSSGSSWSTGQVPGPSDDVVIPAIPGGVIDISSKAPVVIHSLSTATTIWITGDESLAFTPAVLDLGGPSVPGAPIPRGTLVATAPIRLIGGVLADADVQAGAALSLENSPSPYTTEASLTNVTLHSSLSLPNKAVVFGGLTLADGSQLDVLPSGGLALEDATVDGNGQIVLGTGTGSGQGGTLAVSGATLRPGITVHGPQGTITTPAGTLINEGTIEPDPGGTFTVGGTGGGSWTNAPGGLLKADAGTVTTGGSWTNAGEIDADGGGTMTLGGAWSDTGKIVMDNSTLNLGGTFTSAAGPDTITRTGGTVNLTGTLNNAGATLILDAATGSWNLAGGTLRGGTLVTLDGSALVTTYSGGTLDGLTLGGTVNGQDEPGVQPVGTGSVTVTGGLTLDDLGAVSIDADSFLPTINFQGDQGVTGSGQIRFDGRGGTMRVLGNLVLGQGVSLHGTTGYLTVGSGSLTNDGTIAADGNGTIELALLGGTTLINGPSGLLEALNGGAVYFDSTTASWSNAAGGILRSAGGVLHLDGAWSNAGSIAIQDGIIDLGGSFTTAGLGSYTRTGGTVNLTGTLDNTGATLAFGAATGSWNLAGGVIRNGALATLDGTDLETTNSGGTLDGLTLGGTVNGQARPGNVLVATGSGTAADGLTLANGSVIRVSSASFQSQFLLKGGQTVGGNGQIQFAGNGGSLQLLGSVTFGPGLTVHGTNGTINVQSGSLLNQGTIVADAGGPLILQGAAGTSWSSTGLITSVHSTMELGGAFRTSTMGTIDASQGFVGIAGTLTNDVPLALTETTGSLVLDGGTIHGGLITTSGAAELLVRGGGTLDAVTLQGTLADDLFGSGVNPVVTNGLTLVNGTIKLAGTNSLAFTGVESLGGTGTISIDSQGAGNHGLLLLGAGTALTVAPGISIHGHGYVGAASGSTILMNGTVSADDGGTLAVQGATNLAGGVLTGGTWQATNNSTLEIIGQPITTDAATILLSGPNSHIYSDDAHANAFAALAAIAAGARLTVTGGAIVDDSAGLANAGAVTLGLDSTLTVASYLQSGGSTVLNWGTLATVPHAGVIVKAGSFSGPGAVQGDLTNAGSLDLGTATGILTVAGNFTQTASGVLSLKIGGTSPGNQYDRLKVTGTANLGGSLGIALVNGFGTSIGQAFQVLTFAGEAGNFAAITGLSSGGQLILKALLDPSDVTLQAISTQPDLVVQAASVTTLGALAGQPITVNFTIANQGGSALSGSWVDEIFLSGLTSLDSSAILLGQVTHSGGLAVGASYQGTLTAILPGTAEGNYHLLVEADSQMLVTDVNRSNNVLATPALGVSIPALDPGMPISGTIAAGQDLYYRVTIPAGKDMELRAQFDTPSQADFLVRSLQFPTLSAYDTSYQTPADLTQTLILPGSQAGTEFILLHGLPGAGGGMPFSLQATISPLKIQSYAVQVGPAAGGLTSLSLTGASFTAQTTVRLVDATSTAYAASSVGFIDSTHLSAQFNLGALPAGKYSVEVVDGSKVATAATLFDNAAVTDPIYVKLDRPSIEPGVNYITVGGDVSIKLEVWNTSDNPVFAPVIQIVGTNVGLKQNPTTIYPWGTGSDGLLPLVPPHAHTVIEYGGPAVPAQAGVGSSLAYGVVDLQAPIDWAGQKDSLRPATMPADAWNAVFANLIQALGPTPAAMQQVLLNDKLYLSQLGETVGSLDQLMGFELMKADGAIATHTLGTMVDDSIPAPGLPLTFQRTSLATIDGRYRLGTLGRGWVSNWDISATTDASGAVTIFDAGQVRSFAPLGNGQYQASPGDYGTLTRIGGGYQLREKDGTIKSFLPDGHLNYVQDPSGNRITAGYSGGLLTSLSHSDGDWLSLAYNAQGRIASVADSAGWVTTYAYDATGEHLLSVANADGTTHYTYVHGPNPVQEHALQSITNRDGTHTYLTYDSLGRLSQSSGDLGAGQLNYTYFNPGGYDVTDSNSAVTKVLYDINGQPARITDPLGNVTQFRYDSNGQLTWTGLAGGASSSYSYDNQGNISRVVDLLGNTSQFSYNNQFGSLQNYVDPLGNSTGYQQDSRGNPLGITYADGSTLQLTPDAQGSIVQSVDARGQVVASSFNSRGQVIEQTFSDGTHTVYTYDGQGNLVTASDAGGTTKLAYDNAHRVIEITYPNGQSLTYTYDAGGRRTSLTDQTGFTENYQYDAAGRLAGLTDGQHIPIASYTYDPAGRLVREDLGNGTYTTYSYDLAGDLTSLVNYAPGGSINSRFDYTYDARGLVTSATTLQGTTTYGYDAAGELTSAILPGNRVITYAYDAMGNRTVASDSGETTLYATNDLNQYTSAGGISETYDAAGNLVAAIGQGNITVYSYDTQGRLTKVQTTTDTWTYQYDALGNRIGSTHNGQAVRYLVDPFGRGAVVGEFDGTGKLVAHYTQGLGLTSRVDASNSKAYYNFDSNGNTVGLSGSAGIYVDSYSYLPFGGILSSTQSVPNPFQFGGANGVMSQGNGLDIMGARFYDPSTGRFLSRDPIGVAGGGNVYAYVKNNPVSFVDPTGLDPGFGTAFGLSRAFGNPTMSVAQGSPTPVWTINSDLSSSVSRGVQSVATSVEESPGLWARLGSSASGLWASFNTWAGGTALGEATSVGGIAIGAGGSALLLTTASIGAALFSVGLVFDQASKLYMEWPRTAPHLDWVKDQNGEYQCIQISAIDPNYMSGPSGYGPQGFVQPRAELPYEIGFENESEALAPAQTVTVTQQLDPGLDWSTFQLGGFSFGGRTYTIPAGRQDYATRIDATSTVHVFVDVTASFNPLTGRLTWQFTSIDPKTLDQPTGNLLEGFLPPNKTAPEGQGWVSYTIQPKAGDATGTTIQAQASVVFNTNAPIETPAFVNTIDAGAPASAVAPLPPVSLPGFTVHWGGSDDQGGSGIAAYDVFFSDDGGPFTALLLDTTATSATFVGEEGHTYRFYCVATDNVGHVQPTPASAQTQTLVLAEVATTTAVQSTPNPSSYGSSVTFTATVAASKPGADVPTGTVQFVVDGANFGAPVALVNGIATSPAIASLAVGNHSVAAVYTPDSAEFVGSEGALNGGESVNRAGTTIAVASSLPAPVYGDALTFTATVTTAGASLPVPTGTVQFLLNGAVFGAPVTLVGGIAMLKPTTPLGAANYTVSAIYSGDDTLAPATAAGLAIAVSRAHLILTAADRTRVYGQPNPGLSYTVTGFANGEGPSVLSGTPVLSTTATAASPVGLYSITVAAGTLSAANYDITRFVAGTLDVTRALLTVTANNVDMVHGDAVPFLPFGIGLLVNGDTPSVISGVPRLTTTATGKSAAGAYPINVDTSGMSAANYDIVGVPGTLTVHPKVTDVRVRWGNQSVSVLGLNRDLPFANIRALEVVFSDPVQTPAVGGLSLVSRANPGVSYAPSVPGSPTASADITWELPSALGVDLLTLSLDRTQVGATLDGRTIGLMGGTSWNFDVLPGDLNGDRAVTGVDLVAERNATLIPYSIWADLNGDGKVDVNDAVMAQKRVGSRLPTI